MKNTVAAMADGELKRSRLLAAPRALGWKLFTDPGHSKNW